MHNFSLFDFSLFTNEFKKYFDDFKQESAEVKVN